MENTQPEEKSQPIVPERVQSHLSQMIIFGFLMLLIGFTAGYFTTSLVVKPTPAKKVVVVNTPTPWLTPTVQPIGNICNPYGVTTIPEDFLQTYTVKPGDTLSDILTRMYGDTSRLDEFLTLNNLTNISSQSALEAGSKVALPPKEVTNTTGKIFAARGQLRRIDDKTYWLRTRTDNSQDGDYPVTVDSRTKFVKVSKIGQCVKAVMSLNNQEVLYITPY